MSPVLIETLFFAAIAAYIFYRYKNVLGQRPDESTKPKTQRRTQHQRPTAQKDNVIAFDPRPSSPQTIPSTQPQAEEDYDGPVSMQTVLDRMVTFNPNFHEKRFLDGAKKAFTMIVNAFAKGEKDTLKPLLASDVFNRFSSVIDRRTEKEQTVDFTLDTISGADITTADLTKEGIATIGVEIRSRQANIVKNPDGSFAEDTHEKIDSVVDLWTFQRDLTSKSPVWSLISTA